MSNVDIAKLMAIAKLSFDEKSIQDIGKKINSVVQWIDDIQSVNTENIAPMVSPLYQYNGIYNNDIVNNRISSAEALKNAPDSEGSYFLVPKVIE